MARRVPRLWAFVPPAVALHLLAFALWPHQIAGGPNGAGAGGADVISLAAADGTLSDLVAQWERPPEAAPVSPTLPEPAPEPTQATVEAPPALPAEAPPETAPAPQAPQMDLPAPVPDAPPAPVAAPVAPKPPEPAAVPAKPKPPKVPKIVKQAPPEAAAKTPPPGGGSAGSRAAGAGGGTAAGVNGSATEGSLSPGARRSALAEWGGQIRARIERAKRRPEIAVPGRVKLDLRIGRDGRLVSVSVAQSGGAALDAAAVAAVRTAGRFPAAPATLAEPSYPFTLTLLFNP